MEISESVCRKHVIIFKNFNERVNSTGRLLAPHHSVVSESLPSIEGKDVAGLPLSLLREGGSSYYGWTCESLQFAVILTTVGFKSQLLASNCSPELNLGSVMQIVFFFVPYCIYLLYYVYHLAFRISIKMLRQTQALKLTLNPQPHPLGTQWIVTPIVRVKAQHATMQFQAQRWTLLRRALICLHH